LGFDTSYFLPDFTDRTYIRNYVSDKTAYEKIIDVYENKEDDRPLFIFEVTMQNHGGYTDAYKNFTPDIHVQEKNEVVLDRYLSLIKKSDEELQNLIEYFKEQEEDTIIAFFGDHQPNDYAANKVYRLSGKTTLTEADAEKRYIVPYVIWANFDIGEGTNQDTDISYLAANVLKEAGISTNGYQNFLLELEEILADNSTATEEEKDEYRLIYQKLQYYYMFE
jgi:phosphoglycerol transferase MdoB-like AlkP superfamily enzyme